MAVSHSWRGWMGLGLKWWIQTGVNYGVSLVSTYIRHPLHLALVPWLSLSLTCWKSLYVKLKCVYPLACQVVWDVPPHHFKCFPHGNWELLKTERSTSCLLGTFAHNSWKPPAIRPRSVSTDLNSQHCNSKKAKPTAWSTDLVPGRWVAYYSI